MHEQSSSNSVTIQVSHKTLQDFGTMSIFKRTFSQDLDLLEQHLTKETISQTDCKTILTKLRTTFENAFNSEFKALMQKYTRFDAQSLYDTMICNMDSIRKYMLEITLHQQRTPQLDCIQQISKGKQLGFYNKRFLSKEDLKGTRIEHGFKRAFMSLFGQEANTFTSTMLLNVDQLQKQLDKDEFQKDESMAAFWVVNNQFQKFIDSQFTLDYDSQMTYKYFIEYTGIDVKHFKDTPLQHMSNVKKFVAERTRHPRQYDRRLNKRQLHTQENKIDTGKAVDDALVVTESSGTESEVQDDSNRSGNDTDADDAEIRPIYDEEPMAEVQVTAECNIFAIGQQHTEQPEIINEGRVHQYPEQCQVKNPMLDSSPNNQTTEYSKQSLESENILLKKSIA
ncbi:hypothetical protein Tco_1016193 [Tanacetum coccineum]|uniref:Uncharacterized protein n=1 Tax=Tanacetum coccineum TaxID=301880 RepID=A0ABQ5FPA8_9ASTR